MSELINNSKKVGEIIELKTPFIPAPILDLLSVKAIKYIVLKEKTL